MIIPGNLQLELKNIGKRYNRQWLFRHINLSVETGKILSVTGRNGSGKSTLLQIAYGLIQPSEGEVLIDGRINYEAHKLFALTSPYMELPLEFSIAELHDLYYRSGKLTSGLEAFLSFSMFSNEQAVMAVKHFSSGMQQRLKTAFCLSSTAAVLLLDEPLSNMDKQGELWYKNCMSELVSRIVIIAGNNPAEYEFSHVNIQIS